MKKLALLLFFALTGLFVQAQDPFSIDVDTLCITDGDPNIFELILDNHITNNTGAPLNLRWQRIDNTLGAGLSSSICIRDLCYPQQTSSNSFTLDPNEEAIVSVHIFNPMGVPPMGTVVVRISLASDPTVFKDLVFLFKLSSDTDEAIAEKTQFFPNPVHAHFQLSNADWVKTIQVMDIQGKLVQTFHAASGRQYIVADLPQGTYTAVLFDEENTAVRSIRFEKM